jgi:hypothetical protein
MAPARCHIQHSFANGSPSRAAWRFVTTIDAAVSPELTTGELKDFGVGLVGRRCKLLAALHPIDGRVTVADTAQSEMTGDGAERGRATRMKRNMKTAARPNGIQQNR